MRVTKDVFGMDEKELRKEDDSGYTKEERLLLDKGLDVKFFDTERGMEEFLLSIKDSEVIEPYKTLSGYAVVLK